MSNNPNRDLGPDEVEKMVAERLPHLAAGLGRDRSWMWWSGDKPSDEDRKVLVELGFGFTPKPHAMPDGGVARWFHACGGAVLRRGRHGKSRRQPANQNQPANRMAVAESNDNNEAFDNLARLADAFG